MPFKSIDAPVSRKTLEHITQPFQVYFCLFLSLAGSGLFIAGIVLGGLDLLKRTTIPDPAVMVVVGLMGFGFFFPWFLCLYSSRILLLAVRELEKKVEHLSHDA